MKLSKDSIQALESLAAVGALANLHGAIGALHDQLERAGALKDPHTHYLMLRLRREEAVVSGRPDAEVSAQRWQHHIDAMAKQAVADADPSQLPPVAAPKAMPGSHSRAIRLSALDAASETAPPRILGATFVRAGERMGFGHEEPLKSARVVFHTVDAEYITSVSAHTISNVSGQVQFEVAKGWTVPRADVLRLRDWAMESLRRQAADGVLDGQPVNALRRSRP
ncbi:hypothetical protein ABIC83_002415 [Roseateles asaccharophilus]|uniref:hypothetical protein n=1 Tax=Roseateles asaccharophilus TaxID=582607 RepID=UPI003833510E